MRKSLSHYGFRKTVYLVLRNIVLQIENYRYASYDRRYNISTVGDVDKKDLDVSSENREGGFEYVGVPLSIVKRMISRLPYDPSSFVFFDVGSGKGRALFCAAQYNFKKVIGIEYAKDLHLHCEKNIAQYRARQRAPEIQSVCADATEYDYPDEDLLIFMYNPFDGKVMELLLNKLEKHHKKYGKKIVIGYYNPKFGEVIQKYDFLRQISPDPPILFVSANPVWPMAMFVTDTDDQKTASQ